MRQVTKLVMGEGIRYESKAYGWPENCYFLKGTKVGPTDDILKLMELGRECEDNWGRDHGKILLLMCLCWCKFDVNFISMHRSCMFKLSIAIVHLTLMIMFLQLGNGWLLNHPLKKMYQFQQYHLLLDKD